MGRAIILQGIVNTDQIISGEHVRLADYTSHLFEKYRPDINRLIQTGEIDGSVLVAGRNFGSGSSRERAAIGLKDVGVDAVVAISYNTIWERNAINCGLRIYRVEARAVQEISDGDEMGIIGGTLYNRTTGMVYSLMETPSLVQDVWNAGGLVGYVRQRVPRGR